MKKFLITLLVLVGLACVALVTCPDRDAHKQAIMTVVNEKLNEKIGLTESEDDYGLALFGKALVSGIGGFALDQMLTVNNHFVYSEGIFMNFNGEKKTISVGVFGHVFTVSKKDIDKALENNL